MDSSGSQWIGDSSGDSMDSLGDSMDSSGDSIDS